MRHWLIDGYIVGVLIRQVVRDNTAIRVCAIGGVLFRKFLARQGIEIPVFCEDKEAAPKTPMSASLLSRFDELHKMRFDVIQNELISGKGIDTWEKLEKFIEDLEKDYCSTERKSEYYYIAAVWAMNDDKQALSRQYLDKACSLNSKLDTRIYNAYICIQADMFDEAKKKLVPINNENVLNVYLSCLLHGNKGVAHAKDIISTSGVTCNAETNRWLALFELKEGNFENAKDYINKAIELQGEVCLYRETKALIYYQHALHSIFSKEKRLSFCFGRHEDFIPSTEQQELLEQSLQILKNIEAQVKGTVEKVDALKAMLIVSSYIPGKDVKLTLDRILEISPLNPEAITIGLIKNIVGMDPIIDDFLKLQEQHVNSEQHDIVKMEVFLRRKQYPEAKRVFAQNKKSVSEFWGLSEIESELTILIECDELDEAERLLKKTSLEKTKKARMKIGIWNKRNLKAFNNLVNESLALAKTTHLSLDFQNANTICKKYSKWNEMQKNAKLWYSVTNEIFALTCLVESLYEQGKYLKALKQIEKIEGLAELSQEVRYHKLNCLAGQSLFKEAIECAKQYNMTLKNPQLVLFQARAYLTIGKKENAISLLRTFAESDVDKEVYQQLIELLKSSSQNEAFEYAYKLYLAYPKDKDIIRYCGHIGILAGRGELTKEYYPLLESDAAVGKEVQVLQVCDVQDMIKENRKRNEKTSESYNRSEIPIHTVADTLNLSVGSILYQQWKKNACILAHNACIKNNDQSSEGQIILLDYTACVAVVELNLMKKLVTIFSEIWITTKMLPLINNDVGKMSPTQEFIVKQDRNLLAVLKESQFVKLEPVVLGDDGSGQCKCDIANLKQAELNDAWIVDARPAGETFNQPVPEGWYQRQLYPDELYHQLKNMQTAHPAYNEDKVRSTHIKALVLGAKLILDKTVLDELYAAGSIQTVFSSFNVFILAETIQCLENTVEDYEEQIKGSAWLDSVYKTISTYVQEDIVKIAPQVQGYEERNQEYSDLLIFEFLTAMQYECDFAIDDRMAHRYTMITTKSNKRRNVYSVVDILCLLQNKNAITEDELFVSFDKLMQNKYSHFMPCGKYIFRCLKNSKLDEYDQVVESLELFNIRRSYILAFQDEIGVSEKVVENTLTERRSYLLRLVEVYRDILKLIWTATDKDIVWKNATTKWVMVSLGEMLDNISPLMAQGKEGYVRKIECIIEIGMSIFLEDEQRKDYAEWLFSCIGIAFSVDEDVLRCTAKRIALSLATALQDEMEDESESKTKDQITLITACKFLSNFPQELTALILKEECMESIRKRLTVNSTSPSVAVEFVGKGNLCMEGVLQADEDAMEAAILFVCAEPLVSGELFLSELADNVLEMIPNNIRYRVIRFLWEISWYLPSELQPLLKEKKAKLNNFECNR